MQRAAIAAAHRWMAPGLRSLAKGHRAFCSWDEDSVTMAVEAGRDALGKRPRADINSLTFVTCRPSFADLPGASLVAGALHLRPDLRTLDIGRSQRAGVGGLLSMLHTAPGAGLFLVSDHPAGKPASTQEMMYGAGAAAFTVGKGEVLAELLGSASLVSPFVDQFRASDSKYGYVWEERWVRDEGLSKIVPETVRAALLEAGVEAGAVKQFIFGSPLRDAAVLVARKCGVTADAVADPLDEGCGYAGTAHSCLMLAHCLETAQPGDLLVVVGFGLGCDVLVLRATEDIRAFKPRRGVSGALADTLEDDSYLRMLSFDGAVDLEWGMRAEKQVKTALTEQFRSSGQLATFAAGRCPRCGTVQFPQLVYCVNQECRAPSSDFRSTSLADEPARLFTSTADWLSYYPSPPMYVGFVDFDIGARVLMEIVDVGATGLDVGTPLKMAYRIKDLDYARGYPRYFWKAMPLESPG
jgi:3-hydroxy-3-methylglutaryl CoA synthase